MDELDIGELDIDSIIADGINSVKDKSVKDRASLILDQFGKPARPSDHSNPYYDGPETEPTVSTMGEYRDEMFKLVAVRTERCRVQMLKDLGFDELPYVTDEIWNELMDKYRTELGYSSMSEDAKKRTDDNMSLLNALRPR